VAYEFAGVQARQGHDFHERALQHVSTGIAAGATGLTDAAARTELHVVLDTCRASLRRRLSSGEEEHHRCRGDGMDASLRK
jgi:hypothetical protein